MWYPEIKHVDNSTTKLVSLTRINKNHKQSYIISGYNLPPNGMAEHKNTFGVQGPLELDLQLRNCAPVPPADPTLPHLSIKCPLSTITDEKTESKKRKKILTQDQPASQNSNLPSSTAEASHLKTGTINKQ